ncbi:LmeA family phospholipid-binding protein [Nocardioides sp. 616]|uniref:LmeA family phospholipid-binding protein n=1 Tax=Nocardioides sp. 616 TaxID=2268090 RepID=UPI0019656136|nr:LmeA family phospholipid-binding protein [Nocardioides sp. 616]
MKSRRVKDLMFGAAGMLLVLVVAVGIFWWVVTDPAPGDEARSPSSRPEDAARAPGAEPPSDLGTDEAWFEELRLDAATLVTEGSLLHDVEAVGQDVVTSPETVVAGRVSVEATVPFAVVADEVGGGTSVGAAADGQATVVRTVEVLGRDLRVTATGTVEAQGGRLVLEPSSIDIGGPDFFSDATATLVRQLVTIEHDIEGLPDGLVLQDVVVQDDGFRAYLRGERVRLVP